MSVRPLRVVLNAQVSCDGRSGGVQHFVTALVYALGRLDDGSVEYVIVGPHDDPEWLTPYLGPNQRLVPGQKRNDPWKALPPFLRPLRNPLARAQWEAKRLLTSETTPPWLRPAESNGFFESFAPDLVHFPYQVYFRCQVPTVFSPHDLQHLHYPEFYTAAQLMRRSIIYANGCRESQAVTVGSHFSKQDVVSQYGIAADSVHVIPHASMSDVYGEAPEADRDQVQQRYGLPAAFVFYPAQTWPHKNHLGLLRALRRARDTYGLVIPLVCSGIKNDFWPTIEAEIRSLGLSEQVQFLGYVDSADLQMLYQLALFVVHPSLFEGGGLPVLETFHAGTPLTCASATSLPEYAGDSALLFDPASEESMASALCRMTTDAGLRDELRLKGKARSQLFSWEQVGKAYQALYRQVAGRQLSSEDREAMSFDWLWTEMPTVASDVNPDAQIERSKARQALDGSRGRGGPQVGGRGVEVITMSPTRYNVKRILFTGNRLRR